MIDASLPVAMFDSGVGGLTVLHECLVALPQEDYVYLGDTAMFPYGERDPEQLRRRIGIAVRSCASCAPTATKAPWCQSATHAEIRRQVQRACDVLGDGAPARFAAFITSKLATFRPVTTSAGAGVANNAALRARTATTRMGLPSEAPSSAPPEVRPDCR